MMPRDIKIGSIMFIVGKNFRLLQKNH